MTLEFTQAILKSMVGEDIFFNLDKEATKELGLAMSMPLLDEWHKEKYYRRRDLSEEFLNESNIFNQKGIKISPIDILYILFGAKLLFVCKTESEYIQRIGGGSVFHDNIFDYRQEEKVSTTIDDVIDTHLDRLYKSIKERTVITEISHFVTPPMLGDATDFFDNLFKKLNLPFSAFLDDNKLVGKFEKIDPALRMYQDKSDAKRFFNSPSIGYTADGTEIYCYLYGSASLRAFLNMLRISGFIYSGQIDFGYNNIGMMAPTGPVILGNLSSGTYSWDEDTKRPWRKIPDGCLFRSFGYRGLSNMYLDDRTFTGIEKFFIENKMIFEYLKNPWNDRVINEIEPALDILSSTTQIPDMGAKILLLYCCLEHLFVPKNTTKNNREYIVGGINALKSDLLPWFEKLYKVRCDYAHKGYVVRDDQMRGLVFESIANVFSLLMLKINKA